MIVKDCPICFNSSGYTIFKGSFGEGQKCTECNGKGAVSESKHKKLLEKYDIKENKPMNTNQYTTITNEDAFKKWRESPEGIEANSWNCAMSYTASENFNAGFEAATKASESEINSLKERVAELQSHLSSQSLEIAHNDVTLESYAHKVAELQASNNQLREALDDMVESYQYEASSENPPLLNARKILDSTTAQSLAQHDNELLCKVINKLEDMNANGKYTLPDYIEAISSLKVTP